MFVSVFALYFFLNLLHTFFFPYVPGKKKVFTQINTYIFQFLLFFIFLLDHFSWTASEPKGHYYGANIFRPSFSTAPERIQYTVYNILRSKQYYRTVRLTVPLLVYVLFSIAFREIRYLELLHFNQAHRQKKNSELSISVPVG